MPAYAPISFHTSLVLQPHSPRPTHSFLPQEPHSLRPTHSFLPQEPRSPRPTHSFLPHFSSIHSPRPTHSFLPHFVKNLIRQDLPTAFLPHFSSILCGADYIDYIALSGWHQLWFGLIVWCGIVLSCVNDLIWQWLL